MWKCILFFSLLLGCIGIEMKNKKAPTLKGKADQYYVLLCERVEGKQQLNTPTSVGARSHEDRFRYIAKNI